jgi:hypothetical protein
MQTSDAASAAPVLSITQRLTLPLVLALDALVTGLNGIAYLALSPILSDVLGIDAARLLAVGAFLTAFALVVLLVRRSLPAGARAVPALIATNVAWVVASVAVAITGWGDPTPVGTAWILLQAAVVAVFALLQWSALRQHRPGRSE